MLRHRLVEGAEGVRKKHAPVHLHFASASEAPSRAREVAKTVHRDRYSLLKRRHRIGRGEVTEVVLNVAHRPKEALSGKRSFEFVGDGRLLHRVGKALPQPLRPRATLQQVAELLEPIGGRVRVYGQRVHIGELELVGRQTIANGL